MRRLGTELLRRVRRGRPVCLAGKHDDDSPDHDEQPHNRYDEQHDDHVAYDYDSADDHDDGHGSEPHHDRARDHHDHVVHDHDWRDHPEADHHHERPGLQ